MSREDVILVNSSDQEVGTLEKLEAHRQGALHRAVSIFIFNNKGQLLLQKRAEGKYHSAGLWSNTCCSHPRAGEQEKDAAERRLQEEMGIEIRLKKEFVFIYRAALGNDLTEHELDHVFSGLYEGEPRINPHEVSGWKWMHLEEITEDLQRCPQHYTAWFIILLKEHGARLSAIRSAYSLHP